MIPPCNVLLSLRFIFMPPLFFFLIMVSLGKDVSILLWYSKIQLLVLMIFLCFLSFLVLLISSPTFILSFILFILGKFALEWGLISKGQSDRKLIYLSGRVDKLEYTFVKTHQIVYLNFFHTTVWIYTSKNCKQMQTLTGESVFCSNTINNSETVPYVLNLSKSVFILRIMEASFLVLEKRVTNMGNGKTM